MKRTLNLALSFVICLSGFVSPAPAGVRAQEVASAVSLGRLREQYERLLAIERDPSTPAEVRQMNRAFLEERRAQFAAALDEHIRALRAYRAAVAGAPGDDERLALDASIRRLVREVEALRPSHAAGPATPASTATTPSSARTRRAPCGPSSTRRSG